VLEASEALEALAGLDLMVTLHGTDPAGALEAMVEEKATVKVEETESPVA